MAQTARRQEKEVALVALMHWKRNASIDLGRRIEVVVIDMATSSIRRKNGDGGKGTMERIGQDRGRGAKVRRRTGGTMMDEGENAVGITIPASVSAAETDIVTIVEIERGIEEHQK